MTGTLTPPIDERRRPKPPSTLLCPDPPASPQSPDRDGHGPFRAALTVWLAGYVVLTAAMIGIGLLLTHVLDGSVGRWDQDVNEWFVNRRTSGWNDVTKLMTEAFNTIPVVVLATVVVAFLALRRRWREAAFLVLALLLEITVFLSVTFLVARNRPDVPRLNASPETSSFPSGHTAAATVLFAGLALIITCCTRNRRAFRSSTDRRFRRGRRRLGARVPWMHHPTDVGAGLLLGLACLAVAALAVRAASRRWAARQSRTSEADIHLHPRVDERPKLAAG